MLCILEITFSNKEVETPDPSKPAGCAKAFPKQLYCVQTFPLEVSFPAVFDNVDTSGSLTDEIPVLRGVKQKCVLVPLLFNPYINDTVDSLSSLVWSSENLNSSL